MDMTPDRPTPDPIPTDETPQPAENVGDDADVDEHGDELDPPDDDEQA